MSTNIRPEITKKNEYWISKERYYELKHFCLQYDDWKKVLLSLNSLTSKQDNSYTTNRKYRTSPVERLALLRSGYLEKINMIDDAANKADPEISKYLLLAVTKNISCSSLITKYQMPCGKDKFYEAYRKFFYYLSSFRE